MSARIANGDPRASVRQAAMIRRVGRPRRLPVTDHGAATDVGPLGRPSGCNNGPTIYQDGIETGDAIEEWNARVTELTITAKRVVEQRYHRAPRRTYIA